MSLKLTNEFSEDVVIRLNEVCSQPGLSDPRLLSYLYKLCAEATRRTQSFGHSAITIGNEWLKPWQSAAKALNRKGDRLDLWNTLFLAAMREDLWEDVRFVCVNMWALPIQPLSANAYRPLSIIVTKVHHLRRTTTLAFLSP